MKDKIRGFESHNGYLILLYESGRLFRLHVESMELQELDVDPDRPEVTSTPPDIPQ